MPEENKKPSYKRIGYDISKSNTEQDNFDYEGLIEGMDEEMQNDYFDAVADEINYDAWLEQEADLADTREKYEKLSTGQKKIADELYNSGDIEGTKRYTEINEEIAALEGLNTNKAKEIDADARYNSDDWTIGDMWESAWRSAHVGTSNMVNTLTPEVFGGVKAGTQGMDDSQREKYLGLIDERNKLQKAPLTNKLEQIESLLEQAKKDSESYIDRPEVAARRERVAKMGGWLHLEMDGDGSDEGLQTGTTVAILEKQKERLEKAIAGESSVWSGLGEVSGDLSTAGLEGFFLSAAVSQVANKQRNLKEGEQLRPYEEALLQAYHTEKELDGLELNKDRFWQRSGEGLGHSLVFLEQAALTRGVGAIGGTGVKAIVTPLTAKLGAKLTTQALTISQKSLLKKSLNTLAQKGIGYVEKGLIGTGEVMLQSGIMPNTYTGAARKFIGQTQEVTLEDGSKKILVSANARKAYEKDIFAGIERIKEKRNELKGKSELTDADKDMLAALDNDEANLKTKLKSIYNPDGSPIREFSGAESLWYGYSESLKELAAEKGVGKVGDKLFRTAKVWTTTGRLGRITKPISNAYTKGTDLVNKSGFGKISESAMRHTGAGKLIHGVPSEVLEEIAVQLTPSYGEDYSKQLKELTNPTFYVDVITQTLLMGGGFTGVGAIQNAKQNLDPAFRKANREKKTAKKDIRDLYKQMDNSVNDETLANHIVMNTGGTLHTQAEYQAQISSLRNEGQTAEADKLEKKAFFNMAMRAVETETLDDFELSMKRMAKNKNLTEATRRNAVLALPKIKMIRGIEAEHKGKVNYADILKLSLNNMIHDQTVEEINEKVNTIVRESQKDVEQFVRINNMPLHLSLHGIEAKLREEGSEYGNYGEFVDKLRANDIHAAGIDQAINLIYSKDLFDEANFLNRQALKEQLNPKNQEKIAKEYKAARIKEIKENVENITSPELLDKVKNEIQDPEVQARIEKQKKVLKAKEINQKIPDTPKTEKVIPADPDVVINKTARETELDARINEEVTPEHRNIVDQLSQLDMFANIPVIKKTTPKKQAAPEKNMATEKVVNPKIADIEKRRKEMHAQVESVGIKGSGHNTFEEAHAQVDKMHDEELKAVQETTDVLDMQPDNLDENDPRIKQMGDFLGNLAATMKSQLNEDLTFDKALLLLTDKHGFNKVEKAYNAVKDGWALNTDLVQPDFAKVYNDIFGYEKLIEDQAELFGSFGKAHVEQVVTSEDKLTAEAEKIEAALKQKAKKPYGYTSDNKEVKYLGDKIATATMKIPLVGVRFQSEIDESTGTEEKTDLEGSPLNFEGGSNLNVMLDPDVLVEGKEFTAQITMKGENSWKNRDITVWKKNTQGFLYTTTMKMGEWVAKKPEERAIGTQAWINKVPIDMVVDGEVVGSAVHDVAWWNSKNTADFTRSMEPDIAKVAQKQLITEAREKTSKIRNAIFNGNTQMVVESRSYGRSSKIKAGSPLVPVGEANPQTEVAAYVGGGRFQLDRKDGVPVTFNSTIINLKEILENKTEAGTAMIISRSGSEKNEAGEIVPTYVANQVLTNYNQDALKEIEKSKDRMYHAAAILNKVKGKYFGKDIDYSAPTEHQEVWAKTIQKGVKDLTGVNIAGISQNDNNETQFTAISNNLAEKYPQRKKKNPDGSVLLMAQMDNMDMGFPLVDVDGNVTNYESKSGETGYKGMLMDNLHTQYQFYPIQTPKGELYISDVQPRIEVGISATQKKAKATPKVAPQVEKVVKVPKSTIQKKEFIQELAELDRDLIHAEEEQAADGESSYDFIANYPIQVDNSEENKKQVGSNNKILPTFLKKGGPSIKKLAETIVSEFNSTIDINDPNASALELDETQVVDELIEILVSGKTAYKKSLQETSSTYEVKQKIREIENQLKEILTPGDSITIGGRVGTIINFLKDDKSKALVAFADTRKVSTVGMKDFTYEDNKSKLLAYGGYDYFSIGDKFYQVSKKKVLEVFNEDIISSLTGVVKVEEKKIEEAIEKGEIEAEVVEVEAEKVNEITYSQHAKIVSHIFNSTLGNLAPDVIHTNKSILSKMEEMYDANVAELQEEFPAEAAYMVANKDSLLGLNESRDDISTVRAQLDAFFGQELLGEEISFEDGIFLKDPTKANFEYNVKTSLSTDLKVFFSQIVKPNAKNTLDEFAGMPEYYEMDWIMGGLQDMLVDIDNDAESFKNRIEFQVSQNPAEFGFLEQLLSKFKTADIKLQNEVLYRLNQTKNEMHFVQSIKTKGDMFRESSNILKVLDANSKHPRIKLEASYNQNLKQSPIIDNFGDAYRIKEDAARKILAQHAAWKGGLLKVPDTELVNWLKNFGITISERSIFDMKQEINPNNKVATRNFKFEKIFSQLSKNLYADINVQNNKGEDFRFAYGKTNKDLLNRNNSGYLKTLIKTELKNTFNIANTMYIAKKTINSYSQPNFTSEQLRKLKEQDETLINNLEKAAFSKESLLLELLKNDKIRNSLGVSYTSLESLKKRKSNSFQETDITNLSPSDYDTLILGFMQSEGQFFTNDKYNRAGLKFREMKMLFPTLSDSSQMFLLNTAGLDLKKENLNVEGETSLSDEVLDLLYSQLVQPDLNRITQYLTAIKENQEFTAKGINIASQMFTMLPSINTLSSEMGDEFLVTLHDAIINGKDVEALIETRYKKRIKAEINKVITASVKSKFNKEASTGEWVNNGYYDPKTGVSKILDTKYLRQRGSKEIAEQLEIAAFDFTVNNYINQAQIQMLFAGDLANYSKAKDSKFTKNKLGIADATSPIMKDASPEAKKQFYIDTVKALGVNMSKRLKELISPGNRIANSKDEKYIQVMIADVQESSSIIHELARQWHPTEYELHKAKLVEMKEEEAKIRADVNASTEIYENLVKELQGLFPDIASYFQIEATDAQEYTTWQEHLHIMINQGGVTSDQIKKYKEIYTKLSEGKELGKKDLGLVFQPLKPLHAGLYFEDHGEYKSQRFVYVKTSSFPLLPQMTKGLKLDNLRKNIENLEKTEGKKVRVSYESGNKVGTMASPLSVDNLYKENFNTGEIMKSSFELDRSNMSIQQDKPYKTAKNLKSNKREETVRATQIDKILLGNGINKIEEHIFPNNVEPQLLEDLGIKLSDDKLNGQQLYKISTELVKREQEILKRELFDELGLEDDGTWKGSVKTMESIRQALNKRLVNQQDKEILELSYTVGNKKYTKEELAENGLKAEYAEFSIPLWMSPNSNKFESVLNSIVANKLVHLKMSGFSSPVASQEGFQAKDMESLSELEKSGIIFTEAYDPEVGLKATVNEDGKLTAAQVLVASKFKIKKNGKDQLIDLKDYVIKGTNKLDFERIDPELLKMFSYRIPTSAHQSGALIEVVGFLPEAHGDLMIVPKDHTVQIGEDYDIDVRYVYTPNYVDYTDRKDRVHLKLIDRPYVEQHMIELEESMTADFYNKAENVFFNLDLDENASNTAYKIRYFQDKMIPIEERTKAYIASEKDRLEKLLLENETINIYKAVYSSTDNNIQKSINKTLNTDFAEEAAEIIDAEINKNVNEETYSLFDDKTQKKVLKLGASGKKGIGSHSNWVVLNSLLQQLKTPLKIVNYKSTKTEGLVQIPFEMTIGNFKSDGTLGNIEGLDRVVNGKVDGSFENMTTSDFNNENQNSSTDNQKLQIMGKRNENKYTLGAFGLLGNLGFIKDKYKGDQETSFASLFIAQPILRDYVALMESHDSVLADFVDDKEKTVKDTLRAKYGSNVSYDKYGKMASQQMKSVEKTLTGENLFKALEKGADGVVQWAVLEKFLDLKHKATEIGKLQKTLNVESSGLGISHFTTINKFKDIVSNTTEFNLQLKNVGEVFGEKITLDRDATPEKEYIYVSTKDTGEKVYLNPQSPSAIKAANAITTGYNLWKNIFPYENTYIQQQLEYMVQESGKKPGTQGELDLKHKVMVAMKDFIYSYDNLGIYSKSIEKERRDLFIDNKKSGYDSLAGYLNKLKTLGNPIFNMPFFNDLEFTLNIDNSPSLIKFTTDNNSSLNKNQVHETLSMLHNSETELPNFNGKAYTYKDLVKDLTKYALLANQQGGATGFREHIPMQILKDYGVTDTLKKYTGTGSSDLKYNLLLNGDFNSLLTLLGIYPKYDEVEGGYEIPDGALDTPGRREDMDLLMTRINTKQGEGSVVYNEAKNMIVVNDLENQDTIGVFSRQFMQHNPDQAKKLNWSDKNNGVIRADSKLVSELTSFFMSPEDAKFDFLSVKDTAKDEHVLFLQTSPGTYSKLDTLGSVGYNQYSPFNTSVKALELITPKVSPIKEKRASLGDQIKKDLNFDKGVKAVIQTISETEGKYKEVAKTLLPYVNESIIINSQDLKDVNGVYVRNTGKGIVHTPLGLLKEGSIYIDDKLFNSGNKDKIDHAILEEFLHSVTIDALAEWVDMGNTTIKPDGSLDINYIKKNPPAYVVKMVQLYKAAFQAVIKKHQGENSVESVIEAIQAQREVFKSNTGGDFYSADNAAKALGANAKSDAYRTLNLGEFIAGVFLSDSFRDLMSKTQYKGTNKNFFEKLIEAVQALLKHIAPKTVKDSITEHTFDAVLELLDFEKTEKSSTFEKPAEGRTYTSEQMIQLLEASKNNENNINNTDEDFDPTEVC